MKSQNNRKTHAEHRRTLRCNSTDTEKIIWQQLRGRQVLNARFRRQHTIENYIVDFVSFDAMLIVEIDGGQHAENCTYDERRDALVTPTGFKVLRFWNSDVTTNLNGVMESIYAAVTQRI